MIEQYQQGRLRAITVLREKPEGVECKEWLTLSQNAPLRTDHDHFIAGYDTVVGALTEKRCSIDFSPYPVGSKVWVWRPSIGVEPIELKIQDIHIWLDTKGVRVSYSFVDPPRGIFGREDQIFDTYEDALADRDRTVKNWFPDRK